MVKGFQEIGWGKFNCFFANMSFVFRVFHPKSSLFSAACTFSSPAGVFSEHFLAGSAAQSLPALSAHTVIPSAKVNKYSRMVACFFPVLSGVFAAKKGSMASPSPPCGSHARPLLPQRFRIETLKGF